MNRSEPADRSRSPEAERLGVALARLRKDQGLSQAEAGARIGMTSQGWGLYEAGRRPGLFRPDVQRRLTGALGASTEELALILSRVPDQSVEGGSTGRGVESPSRAYRPSVSSAASGLARLQLSNDELAPWAVSGVVLEYDPGRWPRRDQGCVIDTVDGERLVRLYDRADAEALHVRGGAGGLDAVSVLPRSTVVQVAAVVGRLEF